MNDVVSEPPNGIVHFVASHDAPPPKIRPDSALLIGVTEICDPSAANTVSLNEFTVTVLCDVCTVFEISNSHEYGSPTLIGVVQSFNTDTPNCADDADPTNNRDTAATATNAAPVAANLNRFLILDSPS